MVTTCEAKQRALTIIDKVPSCAMFGVGFFRGFISVIRLEQREKQNKCIGDDSTRVCCLKYYQLMSS